MLSELFNLVLAYIGKMSASFRNRTTKQTDVRVRLMNEIISGIQIIKFYAWEQNFAKVIAKIRKKELKAVKGSSYIMALLYSMWAVSRISVFLTLISYVYSGNELTARKVFVVSAFYNILNQSMVMIRMFAITISSEVSNNFRAIILGTFLAFSDCFLCRRLRFRATFEGISADKRKQAAVEITSRKRFQGQG